MAATGAAVLVMTYWNPVDRYGVDRFAADLAAAGGSGLITPDLIPDEAGEWLAVERRERSRAGLPGRPVVHRRAAPQHGRRPAGGWVYAASTMGVTGVRSPWATGARGLVERTRAPVPPRVCVGLGVSTGDQAATVAAYADGVIVGSAFVRALGGGLGPARWGAPGRASSPTACGAAREATEAGS